MKCRSCSRIIKITKKWQKRKIFCDRFCFYDYSSKNPNKGCFKKGIISRNKGNKGIHLSPKTEFKKGNFPGNGKPVGSIYLTSVGRYDIKIAHPNVWKRMAHYVWESHNGPIPKGMLVHHVDGNCLNDKIENLELMTRAEHLLIHRHEFEKKRKKLAAIGIRKRWGLPTNLST